MDQFDFVIIGAGPAGEAATHKARELGATVAIVDRAVVRRKLSAHRLHPVEVAPELRCAPRRQSGRLRLGTSVRAPRLHGQPRPRRRRAGRHEPRPRARERGRGRYPRLRPDRRARQGRRHATTARPASCPAGTSSSRSARTTNVPPIEGLADVPYWTNREATLSASCRRACSCSAAGRPAASWPRSTPGSACRRRSSSPARGSCRPTTRATRTRFAPLSRHHGVTVRTGVRATRARAAAGRRRRACVRSRRRHDRRGTRGPARGRPDVPARRARPGALRHRHLAAESRSRATGACASPTGLYVVGDPAGPELHTHQAHYQGELAVRMALGEDDHARLPGAAAGDVHRPRGGVRSGSRSSRPATPGSMPSRSSPNSRRPRRATRSRPRSAT